MKHLSLTNLFRALVIVLLLWIAVAISKLHTATDNLEMYLDSIYNELSLVIQDIDDKIEDSKYNQIFDMLDDIMDENKTQEGTKWTQAK